MRPTRRSTNGAPGARIRSDLAEKLVKKKFTSLDKRALGCGLLSSQGLRRPRAGLLRLGKPLDMILHAAAVIDGAASDERDEIADADGGIGRVTADSRWSERASIS
jgi:hypothetical protein